MRKGSNNDKEWEMTIREICDEDIEREIFKNDEFLIEINKKIESDPENAEYWYEKGFNFFDYEAFEEAIECYDISIDINPNPVDPIVYYDKAIALDTLERYDEAANSYQIFLKAEPDDSEVLYYLSEVYLKLNRNIDAISCYNRMLEIDPDDENAKDLKIAAMNLQKR